MTPHLTVKELIEILSSCNQDARILITAWDGTGPIEDNQVFHTPDGTAVIIDTTHVEGGEK